MPAYFALVDAISGMEKDVEVQLRAEARLTGVVACKVRSNDFLVRFDVPSFGVVDDFLQTYVRRLKGVKGVEIVTDWDDVDAAAVEAREKMRPLS